MKAPADIAPSVLDARAESVSAESRGPFLRRESAATRPTPASLLTPVLEHWSRITIVFVVTAVLTVGIRMLLIKREYEARIVLATVGSQQLPSGLGSLAGLAGLAGQAGGSGSPDLVASVLQSRRVLLEVAQSAYGGKNGRVIDALEGRDAHGMHLADVEKRIRRVISVSVDPKTSLLTVSTKYSDSSLARVLATRISDVGARTFADVMRSQATAQRTGQEARVEATATQLQRAEQRVVSFLQANRVTAPFSSAAIEQQSLQREVSIASQAYTEAVSAREAAYARELEQTPAVVAVDPAPAELPMVPRYALFYALAAAIAVVFCYCTLILLREALTGLEGDGTPQALRTVAAVRRLPLAGRILLSRYQPPER